MKMKNKNAPANPTSVACGSNGIAVTSDRFEKGGLTKREYAAIAAMQGLLTGKGAQENIAKWSVDAADLLFNELEK